MSKAKNRKKLIKMIVATILFLAVFRLGAFIQLPFIDSELFMAGDSMFGFLDVFSGGALSNFSILALGISPYITASIVIQLLQMDIIPVLKEWSEEGPAGKQKINQLTKYVALGLAFVQALTITIGIKVNYQDIYFGPGFIDTPFTYVYLALVATAGTAFSLWLAEKISAHGVGNGTSMLIVAGIIATFPLMFAQLIEQFLTTGLFTDVLIFIAVVLILILIIVGIVFMEAAQRRIPIQYANRPAAASFRGKSDSHIPIKLNSASVIPVIFAATIMSLPTIIIQITGGNTASGWGFWTDQIFNQRQPIGFVIYILLIFLFSFFYSFLQMNPEQMAENLQKNNAYIPGVRPGEETASYISRVLFKITMVGATYLSLVAAIPIIMSEIFDLPPSVQIGGTSLIIVVGVAVETAKQIKSVVTEQQYRGFLR